MIQVYFAPRGTTYDGVTSLGWNAYEIQQAMLAFQQFENIANVTITRTTNAAAAEFVLVTTTDDSFLGYFNPPGEVNEGVASLPATAPAGTKPHQARAGWNRAAMIHYLIHEFGHGMGLAHPHDNGGTSTVWQGVTDPFDSFGTFDLNQGIYTTVLQRWLAVASIGREQRHSLWLSGHPDGL